MPVPDVAGAEVLDLDAFRPAYTEDPHPLLAELRRVAPVRRVSVLGIRAWLVTRYADALEALAGTELHNDPRHAGPEASAWPVVAASRHGPMAQSISTTDDPDHARLRRLVGREFTPRRVEDLRPRVERICDDLIAGFRGRGSADLVRDFAAILPLTVISDMFGVPVADRPRFRDWSLTIGGVQQGPAGEQPRAWAEISAYLTDLIDRKARAGATGDGDLLDALIAVRDGGDRLSHTELLGMATVLLLAGYATTVNLIADTVLTLLRHPDALASVRAEPRLADAAVEETLRYDGPVACPMLRYTSAPVRIGGTLIPANEVVVVSLASANRDERRFARPDRFDLDRAGGPGHLGFGHGVHYCVGAPLARLEARIALTGLLDACPDLALDDREPLPWRISFTTRGVTALPVTFTPTVRPATG
jgi:cytochrome P450